MNDTLTKDDVVALTRHFRPNEHEFIRGFTYISEQAVTTRIEEIDPAWTFALLGTHQRNEQIVVTARLTIKGVSRDGVGMQKIERSERPDEKTGESKPYEVGEAEKGAATDALKRAARLFGIGRYLLDLPGNIKDMQSLSKWLASQNTGSTPPQEHAVQAGAGGTAPTPAQPTPPNGTHDAASDKPATPKNQTKIEAHTQVIAEHYGKEGKDGKRPLRIKTTTGAYSYNREPFRKAGIDCELWTDPGVYMLGENKKMYNVTCVWHQPKDKDAQAYWKIDKLEPVGKAEAEIFPVPDTGSTPGAGGAKDIPF